MFSNTIGGWKRERDTESSFTFEKVMYFNDLIPVLGSFDLLIYTDKDLVVPEKWEESGPQFITNSEEVRLRSFTTTIHKVNSMVAYKIPVNDWMRSGQ